MTPHHRDTATLHAIAEDFRAQGWDDQAAMELAEIHLEQRANEAGNLGVVQ